MPIAVLVVDDHPIVRRGFTALVASEPDIVVCGEAVDARSAVAALATNPDVVVVDISLGTGNCIDLIREIKDKLPRASVLVLSMHDEMLYAERALRAGAAGYVMKHESPDAILRAIRVCAAGGMFVSEAVSLRMLQRVAGAPPGGSPLDALTDRELHVLGLVGRGFATREIAEELHISVKTVETYRARLKEKMNLRSGAELVRFAVRWAEDEKP